MLRGLLHEASDMQGYLMRDITAYVGTSQPVNITFTEDASAHLALNVSVAFTGSGTLTSQACSAMSPPCHRHVHRHASKAWSICMYL